MSNDAALPHKGTISSEQSFLVHLQSLVDFARELDGQFEAIRKPTDDMASLSSQPMLLGDFLEAGALLARQRAAAAQMHDLLDAVRSAINFAGDVTGTISDSYARYDHHVAGLFRQHRVDNFDADDNGVVPDVASDHQSRTGPKVFVTNPNPASAGSPTTVSVDVAVPPNQEQGA
jgi:hypothetical protein